MTPLDPVNYLGKAKGVPLLLQFATHDEYVAKEKAELFANSASAPKEVRWYDTGHEMNTNAAADRVAWLETNLKLHKSRSGQLHSKK
jgi:predicted esterase